MKSLVITLINTRLSAIMASLKTIFARKLIKSGNFSANQLLGIAHNCVAAIKVQVFVKNNGSLGVAVKRGRIWGYERAYARSYPQIRVPTTVNPNDPK